MKAIILAISLLTAPLSADNQCIDIIKRYEIDLTIKGYNSWQRTIKKHNVQEYSDIVIPEYEMNVLEECILKKIKKPSNIGYLGRRRGL